jgi:hypothetical protein
VRELRRTICAGQHGQPLAGCGLIFAHASATALSMPTAPQLPSVLGSASLALPHEFAGTVLVTVRPEHMARPALEAVTRVMAVGTDAASTIRSFLDRIESQPPELDERPLERGQALLWEHGGGAVRWLCTIQPQAQRLRHSRKYTEGELGDDKSFYFRGPECSLNLKAQNLRGRPKMN